jgi:hypothetical protein
MHVTRAIAGLDNLAGSVITIEGFLVQTGDDLYVAPGEESWEERVEGILIRDASAQTRLSQLVSAWVGGPLYQDAATVTGVLMLSTKRPFPAVLTSIAALSLARDGKAYQVLP